MAERALNVVPVPVSALFVLALSAQLLWHGYTPASGYGVQALPPAPREQALRLLSFGEPVALSKLTMLWLQAFDNQAGVSIPFRQLDYARLILWLQQILALDPRGQYPLLAAARVYSEVNDPYKQRQILHFVYREFLRDPARRWQWLAHAVHVAKHRLKDLPLALTYAQALAEHANFAHVPGWARQMHIFVLEDMGEIESAKILLGGLLESGQIQDAAEQNFLMQRLKDLEQKSATR